VEYLEKSKHLQDQLRELRSEIEVLKVGEKQSELDQLHDEQVRLGETKYSTLRKVTPVSCFRLPDWISYLSNIPF
jgi:merlin protein